MAIVIDTIAVTTASDGSATAYSGRTFNGRLVAIQYTKTDFTDGVDFTITSEESGQTLWTQSDVNASVMKYPLTQACSTAGVAATLDGTRALLVPIAITNERIKVQIAQGGNAKQGSFSFAVEGY
jgi:hypothetical protein